MCGIAGIVKFDPRERVNEARLTRMRDVLRHRGPDGEGLWIDGPVGFAHRRLAIVDVVGGRQPMASEDGDVWITYNGEIYNHPELRDELRARGRRYRTRSDTETVLHLYGEDGDDCVERLSGMFAFAIWDRKRRRLLLARDRLGIKPLYYALTDDELLFASEIKAILAAGPMSAAVNVDVLPEFLATRSVAGPQTFFRGIRKLLPGRTLAWSAAEGVRRRRYWRVPPAGTDGSAATLQERADELRERLRATVRRHLMSDVPLGVFLSGGLDSSGLAALMAPLVDGPLRTFSVGFADPGANELPYARLVARAIGAEHRDVLVPPERFFAALPDLVWHEDEPIAHPSSVPLHFVSCLAREHVKVVLTGEGADELFLGYPWYRVTAWNERLGRGYFALVPPSARSMVAGAVMRAPARLRRYAGRTFLALAPGPRGLFCENFAVFREPLQRELLRDPRLLDERDPYGAVLSCYHEGESDVLGRLSRSDLQTYLVELLMKQDQMSMAASIESRVPFLDHQLVEHVVAMPSRFKVHRGRTKVVLREALRDAVPPEVLARPKMGFPVPIGRWLRGSFWPVVEEFVLGPRTAARGLFDPAEVGRIAEEHRTAEAEHGDRLWLLANLEIWQRIFLDGEDRASVMRGVQAR
jgi:asparagine synthase (glutamine-hydrolysing)